MEKKDSALGYSLLLAASLARDMDAAGLLSVTSRKLIHDGLAELRGELEGIAGSAPAVAILDAIPAAGSD
jgi:hypothetical protein